MTQNKFPPLLHLSYILQQSSDELLLRESGISLSHARILSGLDVTRVRSQHQLAVELNQTEANISRQLQVMKRRGLVSVMKNKKDARQRDVRLTTKGHEAYKKAETLLNKELKSLIKMIDLDSQKLLSSL